MPSDFSETIDSVRQRINIVDVISQHLTLKKAGKNYRALCPFHHEKTPSFMVNEEKQIFHCFGCGAGGDVFTFLMRYENLSFYNALTELARVAGVSIPKGDHSSEEEKRRELLFGINETAADYFHVNLLNNKTGSTAREYLTKRGIHPETIEKYRLGYAPPGWTGLVNHFRQKSVDPKMAQNLGLIIPRKQQGWYDQFRNRVIFPITNTRGGTVGFGGGAIDDAVPKYLNSAESLIYKKSQSIYGIHVAGDEIRQRDLALVVEGYFDLLMLHQSGFLNAVAPLGTALTRDQVRIMKRYSRNFVIIFDPDEAGIKATFRAFDPFMEEEVHPKTIRLPNGHDPDSFVREAGPEALAKAIEGAVPLMDAFVEYTMERGNSDTIAGKVQIGRTVVPMLGKIGDPLERRLYARSISERLGVQESDLLSRSEDRDRVRRTGEDKQIQQKSEVEYPTPEKTLIAIMLNHGTTIAEVFESEVVEDFQSEELRQFAWLLKDSFEKRGHVSVGELLNELGEEQLKSQLRSWTVEDRFQVNGVQKAVDDCIRKIKLSRVRRDSELISEKIKEAEKENQLEALGKLYREKQRLIDEVRRLRGTQPI